MYDPAMPTPQSFKSHTRWDPVFHFVLAPIALINIILSIYYTVHQWPVHSRSHLWWIVMAFAFFGAVGRIRDYALKNQNRIIRLEERFRYARLLTPAQAAAAEGLTMQQTIALRFASDGELGGLVQRSLTENLDSKAIKQAITLWRPDNDRV